MKIIELSDAIESQPGIVDHQGYKKWLYNDDEDGLDEALKYWGFNPRNNDGTISLEE